MHASIHIITVWGGGGVTPLGFPTEVNNRVQSLLLNYHFALLRSGDFTLKSVHIK